MQLQSERFSSWQAQLFSRGELFATLQSVACHAPLLTGFSWQEYWSGLPFPPPGDHPDPGSEPLSPLSPALQVDSLSFLPLVSQKIINNFVIRKDPNVGKDEGKKRRRWQRARWLGSLTDSKDMILNNLQETVKDKIAWLAAVYGVAKAGHDLATEQQYLSSGSIHLLMDTEFTSLCWIL